MVEAVAVEVSVEVEVLDVVLLRVESPLSSILGKFDIPPVDDGLCRM